MIANDVPVRIDLSWFVDCYGETDVNFKRITDSNHGMVGKVSDSWIEVDGERVYEVTLESGEAVFAYAERDLVVLCHSDE
jgi:hypothetical protein